MLNSNTNIIVKPVLVALIVAAIISGISLVIDVNANTSYRLSSAQESKLLIEINEKITIMSQDIKYMRRDIDDLNTDYKTVYDRLMTDLPHTRSKD